MRRHEASLCVASFCILKGMEEPAADVWVLPVSSAPEASVSPSLLRAFLAEQQRGC